MKNTKICSKCNISKELDNFGISKQSKDGLNSICKECRNIDAKEYRNNNKLKIKQKRKDQYEKYKKDILKKMKNYYLKKNVEIKEKSSKYKKENPDKIKETNKKYYIKNYDILKDKNKKYYKENFNKISKQKSNYKKENRRKFNLLFIEKYSNEPIFKLKQLVRSRIRQFLKLKRIHKNNKTFDIVGCSPEFLKEHIEKQFTEGMSWVLVGKYIHIDHIIPLSSAKTEEDVYKLCHYTNLQPLWAKDNLTKYNKLNGTEKLQNI